MGLLPSRESLHDLATSPDKALPFISRPTEFYVYKSNRTERVFGSGVAGIITGVTPLTSALPGTTAAVLHGNASLELSQKVVNEVDDAVFVEDPAIASAAVARIVSQSRRGRRGGHASHGGQKGKAKDEGEGGVSPVQSAAEHALQSDKYVFVYYYEHRVLPLTREFFPSPDCLLFQQLWRARQQQNPRYHFQLDQTWSPGALLDPTAHYESVAQLAGRFLEDMEAASLTSASLPTREDVLASQRELAEVKAELQRAGGGLPWANGGSGGATSSTTGQNTASAASPSYSSGLPFSTPAELYNLIIRDTNSDDVYESDDQLRSALETAADDMDSAAAPSSSSLSKAQNQEEGGGEKGKDRREDEGSRKVKDEPARRLRPVPCAIVLVRRCMPAQSYRFTYYHANTSRHHKVNISSAVASSGGARDAFSSSAMPSSSSTAAAAAAAGGGGGGGMTERQRAALGPGIPSDEWQAEVSTIHITGEAVRCAVAEAQRGSDGSLSPVAAAAEDEKGEHDTNNTNNSSGGNQCDGGSTARAAPMVYDDSTTVPWLQVRVDGAPLSLAEMRVVGMCGCWTVEEVLRHSLFLRSPPTTTNKPTPPTTAAAAEVTTAGSTFSAASSGTAACDVASLPLSLDLEEQRAQQEAILRRACPHGVPSSTLLNLSFFEKQVGDKEQCHTYFALCRLFAHELRVCVLQDVMRAAQSSGTATSAANYPKNTSNSSSLLLMSGLGRDDTGEEAHSEEAEMAQRRAWQQEVRRLQAHPRWQKVIRLLSGSVEASASSNLLADLSTCLCIRFSNVPQLQLCRQLRLLLQGLSAMYPDVLSLEAFQAAQRVRNVTAMEKKKKMEANAAAGVISGLGGVSAGLGKAAAQQRQQPSPSLPQASPVQEVRSAELANDSTTTAGTAAAADASASGVAADGVGVCGVADNEPSSAPHKTKESTQPGLSLDPAAITDHPDLPQPPSELQKLKTDGFCSYTSDGLVVFRIDRRCVARVLNQLGFASMSESIEALCVTLSVTAPPPLTYRGELRPPITGAGTRVVMPRPVAAVDTSAAALAANADTVNYDDDDESDGSEGGEADVLSDDDASRPVLSMATTKPTTPHTATLDSDSNKNAPTSCSATAGADDGEVGDGGLAERSLSTDSVEEFSAAAVMELYCNAVRYSADPATDFAAVRLLNGSCGGGDGEGLHKTATAVSTVPSLRHTPASRIGVLPRNAIEQRRGRLLPLRGFLMEEARLNSLNVSASTEVGRPWSVDESSFHHQFHTTQWKQRQQLAKIIAQHQFDVFTVSEAFDGMPFRKLVEMTHQIEFQRHSSSLNHSHNNFNSSGGVGDGFHEMWPELHIEAVDAEGQPEMDSVLNWSPMTAAIGTRRTTTTTAAAAAAVAESTSAGEVAAPRRDGDNGGESTTPCLLSQTLQSVSSMRSSQSMERMAPATASIRVHDPDRILRMGDKIRFAASQMPVASSSLTGPLMAAGTAGPTPTPAAFGASSSATHTAAAAMAHGNASRTSTAPLSGKSSPALSPRRRGAKTPMTWSGFWYVDDTLTTEDLILSWMRRVGGRARESRGGDTKWVRYPSAVLQVLLPFARGRRQTPSGSWLANGAALRVLHPADDESLEPDVLQYFPDIIRLRRYRQWRFSHDGFVYFHGVTVRMFGLAPIQQQPAGAAALPPLASLLLTRDKGAGEEGAVTAAAAPNAATRAKTGTNAVVKREGVRERHVDTVSVGSGSSSSKGAMAATGQQTQAPRRSHPLPASMPTPQQLPQQQQQYQQQPAVPRPPPVAQTVAYTHSTPQQQQQHLPYQQQIPQTSLSPQPVSGAYPSPMPGYSNQVYGVSSNMANFAGGNSGSFNPAMASTPMQQQNFQPPQQQRMVQGYPQPMVSPQSVMYHAGMPANAPGVPVAANSGTTTVTVYVPVTCALEPVYVPPGASASQSPPASMQPPFSHPDSHNHSSSSNSNSNHGTSYPTPEAAAGAPASEMAPSMTAFHASVGGSAATGSREYISQSTDAFLTAHPNSDSGDLRSPGDGASQMQFIFPRADSINSLRSYDRQPSTAVLGPMHVTGSFYGDFYPSNTQPPLQLPQRLTSPLSGGAQSTTEQIPQQQQQQYVDGVVESGGLAMNRTPPHGMALRHDQMVSVGATTPNNSSSSGNHHHYHNSYNMSTSSVNSGSAHPATPSGAQGAPFPPLSSPPQSYHPYHHHHHQQQQQQVPEAGGARQVLPSRRTTADYPPRRSGSASFLAGGGSSSSGNVSTTVMHPMVQRAVSRPIQTAHVDPARREIAAVATESGRPLRLPLPRSGAAQRSEGVAGAVQTPLTPQQQQQQQRQASALTSPVLSSTAGSFREASAAAAAAAAATATPTDVIAAEGITVHVMQRKSSASLRRTAANTTAAALSGVPPTSPHTLHPRSASFNPVTTPPSLTSSSAANASMDVRSYGAMGVSPTGGVDAEDYEEGRRYPVSPASASAAAAYVQLPYEMPAAMSPTTNPHYQSTSQTNSFASGGGGGAALPGQQGGGGGFNASGSSLHSPPQRQRSLRVSHNPYSTRDVTVVHGSTPLSHPLATHLSVHSQGGGGEAQRGQSTQDAFQAALDAQYGGDNEFGSPMGLARGPRVPTSASHGVGYGPSGGSLGGATSSGGGATAAGLLGQPRPNSFYEAPYSDADGVPQTYSNHEMYRDTIADGTTQGFYYSMDGPDGEGGYGDDEGERASGRAAGTAAQRLYGRDLPDRYGGGGGSEHGAAYGAIPAPPAMHRFNGAE